MNERCGMGKAAKGEDCSMVVWVKHGTLRCDGHEIKMNQGCSVKRVNVERIEGKDGTGRP